jgi:hypothetical protein
MVLTVPPKRIRFGKTKIFSSILINQGGTGVKSNANVDAGKTNEIAVVQIQDELLLLVCFCSLQEKKVNCKI